MVSETKIRIPDIFYVVLFIIDRLPIFQKLSMNKLVQFNDIATYLYGINYFPHMEISESHFIHHMFQTQR